MHVSGHFSAAFSSESVEWAGEKAVPWLEPIGETNPWIAPSPPCARGNSAALFREISIVNAQISFAKPRRRKQSLTELIIKIAAYFGRVITLLSMQAINLTDNNVLQTAPQFLQGLQEKHTKLFPVVLVKEYLGGFGGEKELGDSCVLTCHVKTDKHTMKGSPFLFIE